MGEAHTFYEAALDARVECDQDFVRHIRHYSITNGAVAPVATMQVVNQGLLGDQRMGDTQVSAAIQKRCFRPATFIELLEFSKNNRCGKYNIFALGNAFDCRTNPPSLAYPYLRELGGAVELCGRAFRARGWETFLEEDLFLVVPLGFRIEESPQAVAERQVEREKNAAREAYYNQCGIPGSAIRSLREGSDGFDFACEEFSYEADYLESMSRS